MANVIQIKRSETAGATPTLTGSGAIAVGELAVNLADGKLYSKNSSNELVIVGSKDAYDLENAADSTNGGGIKITLNRQGVNTSAAETADGTLTIVGDSAGTVTVTRSGTASDGVITLGTGGNAFSGIQGMNSGSDVGARVEPVSGEIDIDAGNGITLTRPSGNELQLDIDTAVTVDLNTAQTLTNKTLTSPVITTPQINDTTADHQYVFAVSELTADRTVTLPLLTGNDEFVFKAHTQTLTNKTIDLDSNTLTGTLAEFNSAMQGDSFVSLTGSETLTNKTLTSPTINAASVTGAVAGNFTLVFEGATADDFETTLTVADPTADRTITLPDVTGTVVTTGDTGTVTNAMLAGSIVNSKLVNSSITLNGDNNSTTLELGSTLKIGSNDAALTSAASTTGGGVDQVMFSVNVDDSSIEIDSSNGLQVKALGVTNAMLAGSIADSKLNKITTANKVGAESIDITSAIDGHSSPIAIADDDIMLLDDAGTTKQIKMSQVKTFIGVGTGAFAIVNLDVDGGTDKATPVKDDELILADSEASGATVKADVGSVLDIINGDVDVDGSGVATIQANSVEASMVAFDHVRSIAVDANELVTTGATSGEQVQHTLGLSHTLVAPGTVTVTTDLTVNGDTTLGAGGDDTISITGATTVNGALSVTGNLTVSGTTTTVNSTTVQVADAMLKLADGNTSSDVVDIGIYVEYDDTGSQDKFTGFVRDVGTLNLSGVATEDKPWVLFDSLEVEPTGGSDQLMNVGGTGFRLAPMAMGHLAIAGFADTDPHIKRTGAMDNMIIDCGTF